MITIEVKRMNRDHDIVRVLRFDHDTTITSKHYKVGVQAAFESAAESYENDHLLILIYDDDFLSVLRLYMVTYVRVSEIYAHLQCGAGFKTQLIRRMRIAC